MASSHLDLGSLGDHAWASQVEAPSTCDRGPRLQNLRGISEDMGISRP